MLQVNHLSGFGGASSVTRMAFLTSTTSVLETITCPTILPFDVGVLIDFAGDFSAIPSQVVPSGFTSLKTDTVSFYRGTASYKVFNGTESGTSLTGQASDDALLSKILLVFRPNGVINTVTTSTWLGEATAGNPAAQAIAAAGQPAPLIRIAGGSVNVGTTPSFSAGTFDATVTQASGSTLQIAGYTVQNSSPSDDSVDMADFGTNWLVSGCLRFS